jgi:hypothetical protein
MWLAAAGGFMVPTKCRANLIGSLLALVALLLSGCLSSAAPKTGAIATATVAAPASISAGGTDTNTPTPPASAFVTGLNPAATPTPQQVVPSPLSQPSAVQGSDCGRIEMVGNGLVDTPNNAPALDCFWQAYQGCATIGNAQLLVHQRFFETSNNRIFRLDGTGGTCVISEERQAYGLMANTPQISMFTCSGITHDTSGLHIVGCGSDGDFTIPATPIGGITVTPSPVSVPTVRTITLADDGQTVSIPTGTAFLLQLDSMYDWQVQIADQTVVSPYPNAAPPPDSQGIFTPLHQGQTTLTATGDSKCYNATPRCLAPSRLFTVQIVTT